jgi:hypothetical protein
MVKYQTEFVLHKRKQLIDEMMSLLIEHKGRRTPELEAVKMQMVPVQSSIIRMQLVEYEHKARTNGERRERIVQLFGGAGLPVRILSGSGGVRYRPGRSPKTISEIIEIEAAFGTEELVSASLIMDDLGTRLYGENGNNFYGLIYEPTLISVEFAAAQDAYTTGYVPMATLLDDGFYHTRYGNFIDYSRVEQTWGPDFPDKTIAGLSLLTLQGGSIKYNEMLIRCKRGTMRSAILGGILINGAEDDPDMVSKFREALDAHLGPGFPIFVYDSEEDHEPLRTTALGGGWRGRKF